MGVFLYYLHKFSIAINNEEPMCPTKEKNDSGLLEGSIEVITKYLTIDEIKVLRCLSARVKRGLLHCDQLWGRIKVAKRNCTLLLPSNGRESLEVLGKLFIGGVDLLNDLDLSHLRCLKQLVIHDNWKGWDSLSKRESEGDDPLRLPKKIDKLVLNILDLGTVLDSEKQIVLPESILKKLKDIRRITFECREFNEQWLSYCVDTKELDLRCSDIKVSSTDNDGQLDDKLICYDDIKLIKLRLFQYPFSTSGWYGLLSLPSGLAMSCNHNLFKEIDLTRVKYDGIIDLTDASNSFEKVVISHCRLGGLRIGSTPNLRTININGSWTENGSWSGVDKDTLRTFLMSTVLTEVILVELHCEDLKIDLGRVINRMDSLALTFCHVSEVIAPLLGVHSLTIESHNFYEWPTRLANPWGLGSSLKEISSLFQPGKCAASKVELRWIQDDSFSVDNTILDHNDDTYITCDHTIESCKIGSVDLRDRQTMSSIPDDIMETYV